MWNFNHLPTDIVLDIITRLPAESSLDCKLVCKPWSSLVSHHRSFSQMHLAHQLNHSADSGKLSFLVFDEGKRFYYFEYNEEDNDETPIDRIRRINITPPFEVFGSFNGLVCLSGYADGSACICNLVTKEYVKLPEFDSDMNQYYHWSTGFGYLPLTNEYKLVEIDRLRTDINIIEVAVYTVASGNGWRIVERFNINSREIVFMENGVFVNGALHWVHRRTGRIFVFDLTEERFREHVSPPPLLANSMLYEYSIGVLGGVLYCAIRYECEITGCTCSDIWLLKGKNDIPDLKDQVELEPLGWSKEFSFPERKPFAFTKSGGVLCFDDSSLSIYEVIASTSKELVHFSSAVGQIIHHKNTLVSLKELGEGDVGIMESAGIIEDKKPFLPAKQLAR